MSIQQLLHKIQDEDSETAFRQLFDLWYERLFRASFYLLQDDEWAKEVALDVLANVWNGRHTMVIPDDFERYVWTMVRNASLSLWRRERRFSHEAMADDEQLGALANETDETLERDELFLVYERALATLPDRCREVWQRVKEDGMTYAEVADAMGISAKTVDAQLQKAVKHLRAVVGSYLERETSATPHPMCSLILSLLCL